MNNGEFDWEKKWNSRSLLQMELINMLIEIEKVGEQEQSCCCWCCNIGTLGLGLLYHVRHGSYKNEFRDIYLLAVSNIWWMFPGISSKRAIPQLELKSAKHYSLRLRNIHCEIDWSKFSTRFFHFSHSLFYFLMEVRKFTFPRCNSESDSQFANIRCESNLHML